VIGKSKAVVFKVLHHSRLIDREFSEKVEPSVVYFYLKNSRSFASFAARFCCPPCLRASVVCFLLLLTTLSGTAQTNNVKVRLYSLHHESHIKLIATHGNFTWKNCEQCPANPANSLIVEAGEKTLKINGKDQGYSRILIGGDYRLLPEEGLSLSLPLEIKAAKNQMTVLASVPLEDYVAAALAGESGNFKYPESLKAMAVAIRTYAAHFRDRHQGDGFDFCDSTHCQALNFKGISPEARAAAHATAGEMLWYQGLPAATFYDQNCGGMVASAQEAWPTMHAPYLKQHADEFCLRGTPLPWKAELKRNEVDRVLREQGLKIPENWNTVEIASRTASGRVSRLAFHGPAGAQIVSASSVRFAIGRGLGWNQVRSDLYEIETTPDAVIFTGHGAGHGVGLCQSGAEEMAKEGKNYREILAFYYPGTSLGLTAQGLAWRKLESDRFELLSTQPEQDKELLQSAEKTLSQVESDLGWKLDFKPQLKIYPTLDVYRNSTGQPGWVAAVTRGHIISMQPVATLRQKQVLDSTLRHEFTHLLVEAHAHPGTPLWFREGLVLYLSDPGHNAEPVQMSDAELESAFRHPEDRQQMERAYAAARTRVAQMVQQNGRQAVLQWLAQGLK
jgi:stage II sporulation protein D (peptidoglycan lytic transglycosylase)